MDFSGSKSLIRGLSLAIMVAMAACNEHSPRVHDVRDPLKTHDSVVRYNQQMVENEEQSIDDYILRHQWLMEKTQTGLRIMIVRKGKGAGPAPGSIVTIRYTISLLNGDRVYASDPAKPFTFGVGKGSVVNGLEEGVMMMNKGCRASLIVPAHLAFGLLGDAGKIPSNAALVYDVEMLDVGNVKK